MAVAVTFPRIVSWRECFIQNPEVHKSQVNRSEKKSTHACGIFPSAPGLIPPQLCKANEELKQCGRSCEPTCDPTPRICPAICIPNVCQCKTGFVRGATGVCIAREYCSAAGEEFGRNASSLTILSWRQCTWLPQCRRSRSQKTVTNGSLQFCWKFLCLGCCCFVKDGLSTHLCACDGKGSDDGA